jgi:hypothetical protein
VIALAGGVAIKRNDEIVAALGVGGAIHTRDTSFRKAYTVVTLGPIFKFDTTGRFAELVAKNPSGPAITSLPAAGARELTVASSSSIAPIAAVDVSLLRRERLALLATSSAFFMVILDTSIVNLAIPRIAGELGAGLSGMQWIIDGYALVLASLLLTAGTLGDRYGAKRIFLSGLVSALFAAPSLGPERPPSITA